MEQLIAGLKKKDPEAFKEVMALYKNKIFNYLKVLLKNDEIAEELTQDTFVKVYFKAHTLRTDNLKSWIYTIATNLARSEFRKRKFRQVLSVSDVSELNFSIESKIEDEIVVEQLISTLPEKYRIPLVMKEINNFSFIEIANIMKKPIGTIKTLVFRSKQYLRNNYGESQGGMQ